MNDDILPNTVSVLIVDDRPENLLSLEELLIDQGYEIVKASSGNEALRLTLRQEFALILLDVQMPDMDGFETAELMRANPKTRNIPIIFVTAGLKDIQFQFKGYDSGAVDYLAKPIEPLILRSKVKIFSDLYRQKRELELHKNHLQELVELKTTELVALNEHLTDRNKELLAIEEMLRKQVIEFGETHDQLLATEEMLRVQIEEYEAGQKLLNESNRNLQTLFDVSPLAIIVSSLPDGIIRAINHTFSEDFGYIYDRVIGKNGVEIGLWADNNDRERFLNQVHEEQGVAGFSTEIYTCEGNKRTVLLYSNIIDFKETRCQLIVFLDVTEQKRMEDQIRQTQKMDVIGQLAGGIAHDFNNMLTAILGSTELMSTHVKDNSAALKLLDSIQKAASRSADLTGQLLAFSRKGNKKTVLVRIDTLINEVIILLERTINKKIILESHHNAENTYVDGDPALLQNALLNLGVNARDAMQEDGTITFSTTNVVLDSNYCNSSNFKIAPGTFIEISVSDTGTGMSNEIMQHVFEPFFTTKEIGKGTGLGLAAVYGTVTDHHGCITISSKPGSGTTFKLYLPLSECVTADHQKFEEIVRGAGGVLLVDDEEILREVGQALLEDLGYRVYLAEDGEEAIEIYDREKNNISLVILDMLMPIMGGKETLLYLKEKYPDIRVLISSGFHQDGTVQELKEIGAKGFLQKPYLRQELCKAISDAMK